MRGSTFKVGRAASLLTRDYSAASAKEVQEMGGPSGDFLPDPVQVPAPFWAPELPLMMARSYFGSKLMMASMMELFRAYS